MIDFLKKTFTKPIFLQIAYHKKPGNYFISFHERPSILLKIYVFPPFCLKASILLKICVSCQFPLSSFGLLISPFLLLFSLALHLDFSFSSYLTGIHFPPSSKLQSSAIFSMEMVRIVPVLYLARVFLKPPPSLYCLLFLAVMLMVLHGLFLLDSQLVYFSCWFSLLCDCARKAD